MSLKYKPTYFFTKARSSHFIPCVRNRKDEGKDEDDSKRESYSVANPPKLSLTYRVYTYKDSWYQSYEE